MTSMTLTAKSRFTIGKQLVDHLGVKAGEKVVVTKLPNHTLKIEPEKSREDFLDLFGSMNTDIRLTDEELEQAIQLARIARGVRGLA
jgi:antitoxin component of MazEF toxin-antitoxin module